MRELPGLDARGRVAANRWPHWVFVGADGSPQVRVVAVMTLATAQRCAPDDLAPIESSIDPLTHDASSRTQAPGDPP